MLLSMVIINNRKNPRKEDRKRNVRTLLIGSEEFVQLWENSLSHYEKIPKNCVDSLIILCSKEQKDKTLQQIQNVAKRVKSGAYKKIICDTALAHAGAKNLPHDIKRKLGELVLTSIPKSTTLEWEQFPSMTLLKFHKKSLTQERGQNPNEITRKYKDLP